MTNHEIESILPNTFLKELKERNLDKRVIEIMSSQIESYEDLNRIKLNLLNIDNFPDLMRLAFYWKSTEEKFGGWYKIIFNRNFFEDRKTAGSTSEDIENGIPVSLGDIYYTNTARTIDKSIKDFKKK